MASVLESVALCLSMLLWVLFIAGYAAYGGRMRSATGKALMLMALGWFAVTLPLFLHHILLVNDLDAQWVEVVALFLSAIGTGAITWLMVRANGRLPWQSDPERRE